MKTIIRILFFLLIGTYLTAQSLITVKHSCSFAGEETDQEFYSFDASNEANQIVSRIVNAVNLSQNFVVKSADVKNALATKEGNQRYILYNTSFMEKFKKDARTKWAAYCVLAHEIGHHLNNHDFEVQDNRKRKIMELQADKFAGGVLFTLGASLEEAKAGIDVLQRTGESATHPPAKARAEAIANGWKNSQEHRRAANTDEMPPPPTQEEPTYPPSNPKGSDFNKPAQPDKSGNNTTNLTAVSDNLLARKLVGNWQTTFYTNQGALISNAIGLFANYTLVGYYYVNGVLMNTYTGTWTIQGGDYIGYFSDGTWSRFAISIDQNGYAYFTFKQTNAATLTAPYGTTYTYARTY